MKWLNIIFLIFLSTCRLSICAAAENPCPEAQQNHEHEIVLHVGRDGTFVRKLGPSKNPHKGDLLENEGPYYQELRLAFQAKMMKKSECEMMYVQAKTYVFIAAESYVFVPREKLSSEKQDLVDKAESEDEPVLIDMPCESEDSEKEEVFSSVKDALAPIPEDKSIKFYHG